MRVCARAFGTVFNAALIVQVRMKEGSAYIQQLNVHSEQDNIRDPFLRERTVEGRCQILQQYLTLVSVRYLAGEQMRRA